MSLFNSQNSNTNSPYFFKLQSGEELLGTFDSETEDCYVFKNLITVHFMPNEQGHIGVQFVPFPVSAKEGQLVYIVKAAVSVMMSEVSIDLINAYNQKYGSGIAVVSNPSILHS